MSKCGKGCMPECEYFTTGGCISPFNCMYKEESGYINSATSGTVIYTGGMNMTNEEMIENLKCVIADIFEQCEQLKAENAALKERLGKAITPEFKIYEDVYFIDYVDEKGYSDHTTGKPKIREAFITCVSQVMQTEFLYRLQPKDLPQEILNDSTIHEEWWDGQHYYAKEIFKTFEAALARLAELKGEKGCAKT